MSPISPIPSTPLQSVRKSDRHPPSSWHNEAPPSPALNHSAFKTSTLSVPNPFWPGSEHAILR